MENETVPIAVNTPAAMRYIRLYLPIVSIVALSFTVIALWKENKENLAKRSEAEQQTIKQQQETIISLRDQLNYSRQNDSTNMQIVLRMVENNRKRLDIEKKKSEVDPAY